VSASPSGQGAAAQHLDDVLNRLGDRVGVSGRSALADEKADVPEMSSGPPEAREMTKSRSLNSDGSVLSRDADCATAKVPQPGLAPPQRNERSSGGRRTDRRPRAETARARRQMRVFIRSLKGLISAARTAHRGEGSPSAPHTADRVERASVCSMATSSVGKLCGERLTSGLGVRGQR
jgi:hypothetical protein